MKAILIVNGNIMQSLFHIKFACFLNFLIKTTIVF